MCSDYSALLEFSAGAAPPSIPLSPTLTEAQVHSLTLHWTPPPNNGSCITSYCLEMEDPSTVSSLSQCIPLTWCQASLLCESDYMCPLPYTGRDMGSAPCTRARRRPSHALNSRESLAIASDCPPLTTGAPVPSPFQSPITLSSICQVSFSHGSVNSGDRLHAYIICTEQNHPSSWL